MRRLAVAVLAMIALLCVAESAQAQRYAWYPSYYGGGYYRGGYYGGGLPYRGYNGYRMHDRAPAYRAAPVQRYQWYGGPPRAYLGGRGGGWGGEW
jgi:hypothetical protein